MKGDAMFNICQKLRLAGCTDDEIDRLLSDFLEEEAEDYVNTIVRIKNTMSEEEINKLAKEINDIKSKHRS